MYSCLFLTRKTNYRKYILNVEYDFLFAGTFFHKQKPITNISNYKYNRRIKCYLCVKRIFQCLQNTTFYEYTCS